MTAEKQRLVICDAGPLIHLGELGALECLADMGALLVPEAVVREVAAHRPEVLRSRLLTLRQQAVTAPTDKRLGYFSQALSLGGGEREALQLMLTQPGQVFLTDDAAARFVASQLGLEVHGSMGVLIRAIRRGVKTRGEVVSLLESIPRRSTLYVRRELLEEVVRQVQELPQGPG